MLIVWLHVTLFGCASTAIPDIVAASYLQARDGKPVAALVVAALARTRNRGTITNISSTTVASAKAVVLNCRNGEK